MEAQPLVVVLGSAQDGGIPHPGCDCDHCRRAREDSRFRRMSPSVAVVAGSRAYLVDASPDLPRQVDLLRSVVGRRLSPLPAAVFLTHCHWGHYAGLGWLGKESAEARAIPVFCTRSAGRFLSSNRPWSDLVDRGNVDLRPVENETPVALGDGVSIVPQWVRHRADVSDTVAYQVVVRGAGGPHTLLYMPDIDDLDDGAKDLIRTSSTALVDGTFYDHSELEARCMSEVPHPLAARSAAILSSAGLAGRVVFTHLNHTNPIADPGSSERLLLEGQGFRVADDGMILPLRPS